MHHSSRDLCLIATDAISFNVLYQGQLEFLAAQGAQLTLICGGSIEEIDKLRARNVGKVINVGFLRTPHLIIDFLTLLKLIWHFLGARYTTVVYTTPKALLLGGIATCLTFQKRRIAFFQGRIYENFQGLRRHLYLMFDRITMLVSHDVLFVSSSLLDEFSSEINLAAHKGIVLGAGSANGVDVNIFSQTAFSKTQLSLLRNEMGLQSSDFIIIIAGRINTDKGIEIAADVIQRVQLHNKRIHFLFIGTVENDHSRRLLDRIISSKAATHINFTPDIAQYMALADAHLFLSHREGFGNVAIEAASLGIPTIAFDVVGIRDSVASGISGWRLPFGNTEAVVDKILNLAANSEQFDATVSRLWVLEHYRQERVWRMYAKFLLESTANDQPTV